jgi:RNA polymerase sigma factor (sigma-70 family)
MSDWIPEIEKLQAFGDEEWGKVERNYAGRLFAYVSRRILDTQAREDIVQESFLGAVRGIGSFDSLFTFEQYLFGICRNRTIDHMRRRRTATLAANDDDDGPPLMESLVREEETPSRIVRQADLLGQGRELLQTILRDWVQETWEAGELKRLMVIEALFSGGWRNRDTWERFELRDETAVAGIKFRALKRMRELAALTDSSGSLLSSLADHSQDGNTGLDVAAIWRAARVSCPARHWLARKLADSLAPGPAEFIEFHLAEMKCDWCQANLDDLASQVSNIEPLLERVRASTARYLRSKVVE